MVDREVLTVMPDAVESYPVDGPGDVDSLSTDGHCGVELVPEVGPDAVGPFSYLIWEIKDKNRMGWSS